MRKTIARYVPAPLDACLREAFSEVVYDAKRLCRRCPTRANGQSDQRHAGMFASENIQAGSLLAVVPVSCCLSPNVISSMCAVGHWLRCCVFTDDTWVRERERQRRASSSSCSSSGAGGVTMDTASCLMTTYCALQQLSPLDTFAASRSPWHLYFRNAVEVASASDLQALLPDSSLETNVSDACATSTERARGRGAVLSLEEAAQFVQIRSSITENLSLMLHLVQTFAEDKAKTAFFAGSDDSFGAPLFDPQALAEAHTFIKGTVARLTLNDMEAAQRLCESRCMTLDSSEEYEKSHGRPKRRRAPLPRKFQFGGPVLIPLVDLVNHSFEPPNIVVAVVSNPREVLDLLSLAQRRELCGAADLEKKLFSKSAGHFDHRGVPEAVVVMIAESDLLPGEELHYQYVEPTDPVAQSKLFWALRFHFIPSI